MPRRRKPAFQETVAIGYLGTTTTTSPPPPPCPSFKSIGSADNANAEPPTLAMQELLSSTAPLLMGHKERPLVSPEAPPLMGHKKKAKKKHGNKKKKRQQNEKRKSKHKSKYPNKTPPTTQPPSPPQAPTPRPLPYLSRFTVWFELIPFDSHPDKEAKLFSYRRAFGDMYCHLWSQDPTSTFLGKSTKQATVPPIGPHSTQRHFPSSIGQVR
jgi:hypothetical protein